jgi:hypothetical protein
MDQSHASLAGDFDAAWPELDALVDAARAHPGVLGAKASLGAHGGGVVAVVRGSAHAAELRLALVRRMAAMGALNAAIARGMAGSASTRVGAGVVGRRSPVKLAATTSPGEGGARAEAPARTPGGGRDGRSHAGEGGGASPAPLTPRPLDAGAEGWTADADAFGPRATLAALSLGDAFGPGGASNARLWPCVFEVDCGGGGVEVLKCASFREEADAYAAQRFAERCAVGAALVAAFFGWAFAAGATMLSSASKRRGRWVTRW